ncbi:hypothetical protein [Acinetobacter baumannii]|uniref:hypothetical protein n=1 Tax=Acinetobacter baumannii TaxID=470 RepID=UPI00385D4EDC
MAGQLILKSQNALTDLNALPDLNYYINRVEADGGVIYDKNSLIAAFQFIYANNITEDQCFSALSPSWGVKYDNAATVSKLYNLYGEDGDLLLNTETSTAPKLDKTTYTFPTVYFSGSVNIFGVSKGKFNINQNIVHASAFAIPNSVSYGASVQFPRQVFLNKVGFEADTSPTKSLEDYMVSRELYIRDASTNNNPATWQDSVYGYGSRYILGGSTNLYAPFKALSTYVGKDTIDLYLNGSLLATNTVASANIKATQLQNVNFYFGLLYDNSLTRIRYVLGHLAESWVLLDSTRTVAIAISQRIQQKYGTL